MVEDVLDRGNVLAFRRRPGPTELGARYKEFHRPIEPARDTALLDPRHGGAKVIESNPLGSILQRGAAAGLLVLARLLRHPPETADFEAMNDHLLRDIGMSRLEIDSVLSRKDRW